MDVSNDYILLKYRETDGTIKMEHYIRLSDLTKRMKRLKAYGMYFQVIYDPAVGV